MPVDNPNVGVAFALVIGAGAATALGASVVFFPSLVKLASRRVLASALGISAGVMTYVSFVEIFNKSRLAFIDAGNTEENAYLYATLTFFGGVLAMLVVDFIVKRLSGDHHHHDHPHDGDGIHRDAQESCAENEDVPNEPEVIVPHCVGCSDDPVGELEEWQHRAEEEENKRMQDQTVEDEANSEPDHFDDNDHGEYQGEGEGLEAGKAEDLAAATSKKSALARPGDNNNAGAGAGAGADAEGKGKTVDMAQVEHDKKLVRMGINTALAIGIHNFPEGLATFVAALDDPGVGAVLAIAIGIHNIPEGLCVALPIYYATGNRWKAFLWACISGISEPIAALLGWLILANTMSYNVYAILFGLVSGMMVIISSKELLPTAHRYDPEDTVVTYSLIAGMMIMALSLVLFVV